PLVTGVQTCALPIFAAGRGVETDGARDLRVDDPEVTLRRRLDVRCAIPQLGRRVPYPQVLRRVHVRVGRDQALLGHGLPPGRDVYDISALSTTPFARSGCRGGLKALDGGRSAAETGGQRVRQRRR